MQVRNVLIFGVEHEDRVVPRVDPPALRLPEMEMTEIIFRNFLDEPVEVLIGPAAAPRRGMPVRIESGGDEVVAVSPDRRGALHYTVTTHLGRAKGYCDPIIIVYPGGQW